MTALLDDSALTHVSRRSGLPAPKSAGQALLSELLTSGLLLAEEWEALTPSTRAELSGLVDPNAVLALLLEHRMLTEYQAKRVASGHSFGLVLGNYRVLDRLGAGGMGLVFQGEHIRLRKPVAIKVLHPVYAQDPHMLTRFFREVRAVARLQHPNIVTALDVGEASCAELHDSTLNYFVMERVPGQDLEQLVKAKGPLPVMEACNIIHQMASALVEAHKHDLVHRDIKPSNIQITPDGVAKLLDFGLARAHSNELTNPGTAMGSVHYMAPEQAEDASSVDIRADIYSLGATFSWCLTGRVPFAGQVSPYDILVRRRAEPRPLKIDREDVSPCLRGVLDRMLAPNPADRYQTPLAVMEALLPFLKSEQGSHAGPRSAAPSARFASRASVQGVMRTHRVLIVDDDDEVRDFCGLLLRSPTIHCDQVANGVLALEALQSQPYDLVLLDIDMPQMNGREVLRQVRQSPPSAHLKVIMVSGRASCDEMAELLAKGADDYVSKPFSIVQLQSRMRSALRFKDMQDRTDRLNQHLLATNRELEQSLVSHDSNLLRLRNSLVLTLAKLANYRDSNSGQHLVRMQRYCQLLAEEASKSPTFAELADPNYIETMLACVPLYDFGNAIVPDYILLKPGKLDASELIIVQRHTVVVREALSEATVGLSVAPVFFQMAIDISCHHHERYDGTGYPDQLVGEDIPLAARLVAIADVYDALRCRRPHKPPLSHSTAVQVMTKASPGQFDPSLLAIFERCAAQMSRIFNDTAD